MEPATPPRWTTYADSRRAPGPRGHVRRFKARCARSASACSPIQGATPRVRGHVRRFKARPPGVPGHVCRFKASPPERVGVRVARRFECPLFQGAVLGSADVRRIKSRPLASMRRRPGRSRGSRIGGHPGIDCSPASDGQLRPAISRPAAFGSDGLTVGGARRAARNGGQPKVPLRDATDWPSVRHAGDAAVHQDSSRSPTVARRASQIAPRRSAPSVRFAGARTPQAGCRPEDPAP